MNDENKNPWKTLSSKDVYENPWIKVVQNETLNADGGEGIYGVVQFKNIAIGIIPFDEDYNTWLVGQYRYPLNQYSWEICEGGGPIDEDILESAKRELKEELGIVANNWSKLMEMHLSNSVSNELGVIYVAKDLTFHEPEPEEGEVLAIKKVPFQELYQMVMDGEITDSLYVAGTFKAKMLIDKGLI